MAKKSPRNKKAVKPKKGGLSHKRAKKGSLRHKKAKKAKKPILKTKKARKPVKPIQLTKAQIKARNKIDPKTGKVISRHAYEKKYGRGTRQNVKGATRGYKLYYQLVLERQQKINAQRKRKGLKPIGMRAVMNSDDMKSILQDLKDGARLKRLGKHKQAQAKLLRALKKVGRRDGVPDSVPVGETANQGGNK